MKIHNWTIKIQLFKQLNQNKIRWKPNEIGSNTKTSRFSKMWWEQGQSWNKGSLRMYNQLIKQNKKILFAAAINKKKKKFDNQTTMNW